ncbi:FAD-dependent oxidoreductase [Patulibacter sp. SYSU D01012]|uniref:NAD(P)/FAD-dependent oxidoreductase n=1 Tax=Patulibacter sp. SYSU D01012 TaxID=2817381 RepID=UPI001B3044E3|nr:FAD-dependent oxidoreductase [Patulibacter sp. SYSU D01012]
MSGTPAPQYAGLSLWLEQAGDLTPRAPLPGPTDVDVAIVGAGFTGLWSAYYLKKADPSLRIAVLERWIAGAGASGRNGGWCYGHLNGSVDGYAKNGSSRELALAMKKENYRTVDVIGETLAAEGIDAGFVKGGALNVARTFEQAKAMRAGVAEDHAKGFGEEFSRWLSAEELAERVQISGALGAKLEPYCARVQPAKLARGLAEVVERLGVTIYEGTEVTGIERGVVHTARGDVRCEHVVRGTEGYTLQIPTEGRRIQPLTSQIIATEPLPAEVFEELGGWEGREVWGDALNRNVYCQRTMDDRIAIGGRGGFQPRQKGMDEAEILDPRVHEMLRVALAEMLPAAKDATITHFWGGVWGATRDWAPIVGHEPERGVTWAGGYGDGVCASNFAARTMTDLILRRDSELVRYPWINHPSPEWPRDPLVRIGARAGDAAYGLADRVAARRGRSPRWTAAIDRITGLGAK